MTVQRRMSLRNTLLMLIALFSVGSLLCASVAPVSAPVLKVKPVSTANISLAAVVIVVPPTQVANPLTGVKDNQSNVMWNLLNGWVASQGDNTPSNLHYVQYPQSLWFFTGFGDPPVDESRDIGATSLNQQIEAASGQKIVVVGYSQGSSVNTRWLDWYKEGKFPNAPDPANLSFVNAGNPNRPNGGLAERFVGMYIPGFGITFDGATPSDTPYPVTEVAHEYDGFSDFPVYVLNPLADVNALMGILFVHAFYDQVDLNDPSNIVTHDGTLTDVLAHTPVLPIMQPFYMVAHVVGRTETPVLDAISGPLRVIIDSAYDRTTAEATPANFGNPFQHLDMSALNESIAQSVETLLHGAPETASSRTFTQFPDISEVVKAITTSPLDSSALNRTAVQSAEKFLYGTPKVPAATPPLSVDKTPESEAALPPKSEGVVAETSSQQPVSDKPATSKQPTLPKLPKPSSLVRKLANALDAVTKTAAKHDPKPSVTRPVRSGWKPGDGLKSVADRMHKLTHPGVSSSGKPGKVSSSPSSDKHNDNDGS
ncbi:MAG: hypothetical protein JWN75_379 [Candidatus Saccharibacteria bacterium]|nr:hypothetical protein [Candidatus Saccharibacteria bacterium]